MHCWHLIVIFPVISLLLKAFFFMPVRKQLFLGLGDNYWKYSGTLPLSSLCTFFLQKSSSGIYASTSLLTTRYLVMISCIYKASRCNTKSSTNFYLYITLYLSNKQPKWQPVSSIWAYFLRIMGVAWSNKGGEFFSVR